MPSRNHNNPFIMNIHEQLQSFRRNEFEQSNQISLGELVHRLEHVPDGNLPISFDVTGEPPGMFCSYRGHYNELALQCGDRIVTVRDLLDQCQAAIGDTFPGYKGGEYTMGEDIAIDAAGDDGSVNDIRRSLGLPERCDLAQPDESEVTT